jgi:hypothetical protein
MLVLVCNSSAQFQNLHTLVHTVMKWYMLGSVCTSGLCMLSSTVAHSIHPVSMLTYLARVTVVDNVV